MVPDQLPAFGESAVERRIRRAPDGGGALRFSARRPNLSKGVEWDVALLQAAQSVIDGMFAGAPPTRISISMRSPPGPRRNERRREARSELSARALSDGRGGGIDSI